MKKVKKMSGEPTLVRVVWDDAWSDTTEVNPESSYYEQDYLRAEVGYLKSITEREVVVCRGWSNDKDTGVIYGACIRVPRGIVKSITVLALSHRLRGS